MVRASGIFRSRAEVAQDFKTFDAKYPMYAISVPNFLQMGKLVEHSDLLRAGSLTEWKRDMRVLCVSHQWLANSEPDPDNEHYVSLKLTLERLMAGKVPYVDNHWLARAFKARSSITAKDWAELSSMHIWIDYCCIPQVGPTSTPTEMREAAQAVHSIPAYFERSLLMLVLAPVCKHAGTGRVCNYATWRRRGWCRMELSCAILAPQDVPIMICIGGEATPFTIHDFDMPRLLPGDGEFSCCRLGHVLNGKTIPCDRVKCGSVLDKMLAAKAKQLQKSGRRMDQHFWVSVWKSFLVGLRDPTPARQNLLTSRPINDSGTKQDHDKVASAHPDEEQHVPQRVPQQPEQPEQPKGLAVLRRTLGWNEKDDQDCIKTGFSLAHFAALSNDPQAIRELALEGKTNFNQSLKINAFHLAYMVQDATPLIAAMVYADFPTVEALLEAKADPYQRNANAMDCLFLASCRGRTENVVGWLQRFPEWDVERNDKLLGINPCCLNALTGVNKAAILQQFIDKGMDVRQARRWGGEGTLLCLMALCEDPDIEAAQLLLQKGCDPNVPWKSTGCVWKSFFKAVRMRTMIGSGGRRWTMELATMEGSTALHLAAKRGDVELITLLVKSGASVDAKNAQGLTPMQVGQKFFGTVPALLEEALRPPPPPPADRFGASAEV
mmetsp:Transcript_172516/g.547700  ORF Transcript_172516/g.547700 Transcript_172516/m.547700 type:complete len:665 (-) Transcript_172516:118-2112(-)